MVLKQADISKSLGCGLACAPRKVSVSSAQTPCIPFRVGAPQYERYNINMLCKYCGDIDSEDKPRVYPCHERMPKKARVYFITQQSTVSPNLIFVPEGVHTSY